MAGSKWKINRIGLIDFWYYDEEEFYFLNGRLLLRGANGSGKSVTMQSFIPLLLDGNKAPDRLDPFGTKARKIENYLLEDNDGREERTGYLYMEFKRQDSDTYFTVGLGLRARRGKKLDTWYFAITDGRRIGEDFFLYKDMGSKVTLSRLELRNRLDRGGVVLESQREYMKFVNERLFGYETPEEYKELIDLLIQLRTPKLSKDFKPTVLNEILSNSLQPLSEDDLRPMSEAIENMDNLKNRLESLKISVKAADRIFSSYEKYNKSVLYEKGRHYLGCRERLEAAEQEQAAISREEEEAAAELANTAAAEAALREEREQVTVKKRDLDQNDATRIREKQLEAEARKKEQLGQRGIKTAALEQKQGKQKDISWKLKEQQEQIQADWTSVEKLLDQMDGAVAELEFDEQAFLRGELQEKPDQPYSFAAVKEQTKQLATQVAEGLMLFRRSEGEEREYERLQQEREAEERKKAALEREGEQLSAQEAEVKSELIETIYSWAAACGQLRPEQKMLRLLAEKVENFEERGDYQELARPVRELHNQRFAELQKEKILAERLQEERLVKLEEKETQLAECVARKEPEPERSQAVLRNRRRLSEAGIPFQPFYMAVDFQEELPQEQADRLEEALLEMGMLDALVIPGNYEEKALAVDRGMCDRYLFCGQDAAERNMQELLRIDPAVQDLVLFQQLSNLLSSMGSVKGCQTYVDEKGGYGIGVVRGVTGGEYKASFIGAQTREKYRRETIARLTAERDELAAAAAEAAAEVSGLEQALLELTADLAAFPGGEDLQEVMRMWEDLRSRTAFQKRVLDDLGQRIAERYESLREIRIEISHICHKTRLAAQAELFEGAAAALRAYERMLYELENGHGRYLAARQAAETLEGRAEEIAGDLDDLLYDLGRLDRDIRGLEAEIANCAKQLALSNYEEIREELEYCEKRLSEIPGQLEAAVSRQAVLAKNAEVRGARLSALALRLSELNRDTELAERGFLGEYGLGYVETADNGDGDRPAAPGGGAGVEASARGADGMARGAIADGAAAAAMGTPVGAASGSAAEKPAALARRMVRSLTAECTRGQSVELDALQQQFYKNLSELTEYGLFMKTMFDELDGSTEDSPETELAGKFRFRRQVICGKYQGRQVEFAALLQNLRDDAALQESLVKDSDRALFEDILSNTIGKKIRSKIYKSEDWVSTMNGLMGAMNTSSGLVLSLRWKEKRADQEEQLHTRELVELLKKDAELMREEEFEKLSRHFQSKVEQARRLVAEEENSKSFHAIMKEVLDYRQWFEFQLYYRKAGEERRELTNNAFFTLSGGEKAMAMYVPLFSAVVAKYQSASPTAPRLISLDEAFAGVDELNIRDMFKLMVELDFQFIINSQVLWGDCDTVPALAIYQLLRPENAKFVTVIPYRWNGTRREAVEPVEMRETERWEE